MLYGKKFPAEFHSIPMNFSLSVSPSLFFEHTQKFTQNFEHTNVISSPECIQYLPLPGHATKALQGAMNSLHLVLFYSLSFIGKQKTMSCSCCSVCIEASLSGSAKPNQLESILLKNICVIVLYIESASLHVLCNS